MSFSCFFQENWKLELRFFWSVLMETQVIHSAGLQICGHSSDHDGHMLLGLPEAWGYCPFFGLPRLHFWTLGCRMSEKLCSSVRKPHDLRQAKPLACPFVLVHFPCDPSSLSALGHLGIWLKIQRARAWELGGCGREKGPFLLPLSTVKCLVRMLRKRLSHSFLLMRLSFCLSY